MKRLILSAALAFTLSATGASAQENYQAPTDPAVVRNLSDWQDLKFGVLFHFGLYSQPGICESWPICNEDWIERGPEYTYDSFKRWYWGLADSFKPTAFDPGQWADAIKKSGAGYMIFSTKHHDGFCMFDTKQTDFSIAHYGLKDDPRADVAAKVFNALRDRGLKVGAYFSKPDWHCQYFWWDKYATPDRHVNYDIEKYAERWQAYKDFTYNQINELMSNYGKLDILWLDGGWVATGSREDVDMDRIGNMALEKQPGLLIVDRTVGGKWENYCTPEQMVPAEPYDCPWESCMTLSHAWGYANNAKFKSAARVVSTLAEITAKGGSLLLGVGPDPTGLIEQAVVDTLAKIGAWLDRNGEAIYATRRAPVYNDGNLWFTAAKDGSKYYAIYGLKDEPVVPSTIKFNALKAGKGARMTLVSTGAALRWTKSSDGSIKVQLPRSVDRTQPVAIRLTGFELVPPTFPKVESAAHKEARMDWFSHAKLGIFIHWGIYSDGNWSESWSFHNRNVGMDRYFAQKDDFTAANYNPEEWVKLIKESGARYTVLTSKHHDGVALWDTKAGRSSTVKTCAAKRDVLTPFVDAVRKAGDLKLGLYYSLIDWAHEDYPNVLRDSTRYNIKEDPVRWQKFCDFNFAQVNEINTAYKPDLFWFDGDWEFTADDWRAPELLSMIRKTNPETIFNSRIQGHGDYATPEQGIPVFRPSDKWWESCMTVNDSWGFRKKDLNFKSDKTLLDMFVNCLSLGGNLLLDIGPRADGSIPEEDVHALKELGSWIKAHEEAVYDTRAGIPDGYVQGYTTLNEDGTILYVYMPYTSNGLLKLKGLKSRITKARVVGTDRTLDWKLLDENIWNGLPAAYYINVPAEIADEKMTVLALEFDSPLQLVDKDGKVLSFNKQ
ncbi:MAG: alpha-L-fucosidase [Bacteroidales bacterium]|nr:alpha-L-fucosidase [Bacteroidales bacterium]